MRSHFKLASALVAEADGDRTRMTSLEGVSQLAVRAAELGGSLSGGNRDWPLFTGVNGPLMARSFTRHRAASPGSVSQALLGNLDPYSR